jgi:muconolactone delta-isomerase
MISIKFPENPPAEFVSLIPSQRDLINDLMNKGFITDVSLSEDRKKLWLLVVSESEEEIHTVMKEFPLIKYMKYDIEKLLFNFSYANSFPKMSMN